MKGNAKDQPVPMDERWSWVRPGAKAESVDIEEVWNPCSILSCSPQSRMVKVRYDGWDESFDEEVPMNDTKLAKPGTHTLRRRCWVKIQKTVLPAIAFLRSGASKRGVDYLESESKILFLVHHEKKTEYIFLEPKRSISWSDYSKEKAPPLAVEKNAAEPADTLPMAFLKGTLPADDCLQIGSQRIAASDHITKKRSNKESSSSSSSTVSKRATPETQSMSTTAKKPRTSTPSVTPASKPAPKEEAAGVADSMAFELTPSQRLLKLAKSIEETVITAPAAAKVTQRSLGSDGSKEATTSHLSGNVGEEAWGSGSSVSPDDPTMRGMTSSSLSNT